MMPFVLLSSWAKATRTDAETVSVFTKKAIHSVFLKRHDPDGFTVGLAV